MRKTPRSPGGVTSRRALPVGALLAASLLTACTGGAGGGEAAESPNPFGSEPPAAQVDVDAPELRALKQRAGIADCPQTEPQPAVDGGLPEITLPCLGGGPDVHLTGLVERPTVVNLWASWCEPCREELPVLQEYAERAAGRVDVVGIDFYDIRPGAALELARQSGVTYPLLADVDAQLRAPLRVSGMPMTLIIDADGEIAHRMAGEIRSVRQLDDLVADAVGVRVAG